MEEGATRTRGFQATWHKGGSHQRPSVCGICGGVCSPGVASGLGVRQAEIFSRTWVAEKGTWCEAQPLCPRGN